MPPTRPPAAACRASTISCCSCSTAHIPVLQAFPRSRATSIPSACTRNCCGIAGELATFATPERRARDYPAYDHDDLENVFEPVLRDIQDFLSARLGRRAIRLELIERAPNAFVSHDPRPHAVPQRDASCWKSRRAGR